MLTKLRPLAAIAVAVVAIPRIALAQTDEIQVYDGGIAAPGVINLTWHNNFTPKGLKTPAYPGALSNDKNLNGVTEWAYGVTDWFEAGLYLPLYSLSKDRGPSINGGKIRLLFAVPHADNRKFFYAANFEFSYNSKHWDERRYTSEIRPIIGWHLHPVDIIVNPILDNSYLGDRCVGQSDVETDAVARSLRSREALSKPMFRPINGEIAATYVRYAAWIRMQHDLVMRRGQEWVRVGIVMCAKKRIVVQA